MARKGQPVPKCASGVYWLVEPGDTFWKISRKTGVPLSKLLQANPTLNAHNLLIGTRICIPK